ncbi:MAG: thiamine phosphate synthase [Pollutimonas bauzanensis]|uniref:Thiamine-phosphate synthase n=1 Tax=Pollutimonas bauzanensis TaxID=658167 RepID=A0A1M5TRM8_9BURK|nr:thiamine phosphate synthase [Pollutimonas bauzanensis]SHH53417.1 thiamine-phosphate diphosphorylase [Pollutimonas bauzanensis]
MNTSLRFPKGLYGVTPEWDDTDRLLEAISAAASGGMVALQWRRKTATAEAGLAQVRRVAERCRKLGLLFIVNDDWRLAALVDADGVHLGREDGSVAQARLALGSDKIIGCSCYNQPGLAAQALKADVDYVAFGAMYPSSVKPGAVRATLEDVEQGRMLVESSRTRPRAAVVAIGGITADNAGPVVHAGADSIAVISGLFESDDIQDAAARFAALFR